MFCSNDITLVVCLRLHEENPWVIERLNLLGDYYDPKPNVLIVDFGSQVGFKEEVEETCKAQGFDYHYVDDQGTYSAAIAHNRGFEKVSTQFVLFSDIDFFFERNVFEKLSDLASSLEMGVTVDVVLSFAAYHVSEKSTNEFVRAETALEKSNYLTRLGYISNFQDQNKDVEFIAPYSNVYMMNVELYKQIGGYHEEFRGHGSEDFEFFIRLAIGTSLQPLPIEVEKDKYGPSKRDFFWIKQYRGFRRLNEALALPSELLGLKVFHLWHPTGLAKDWRAENDWRRERMTNIVGGYSSDQRKILSVDYINREKTAVCICKHKEHFGYFLPLRNAGYKLIPIYDDSSESVEYVNRLVDEKEVEAFAVFNPYMKSHSNFYPSFLLAKEKEVKTIVVERGALPNTIYYASDVSYAAPEFSTDFFDQYFPEDEELKLAADYVDNLKGGEHLLESSSGYSVTQSRYTALSKLSKGIYFIPLQIDDDMAVTKYVRPSQPYHNFVDSINEVAFKNPDKIFVVKRHPLSKKNIELNAENIIEAKQSDNVHALIDLADCVICYNSGVGLLSILHSKPTVTIGNAFYNMPGTGQFADSLEEGVSLANKSDKPNADIVLKLASWFLHEKYSTFVAKDDIKEFKDRKAHAYKDILVTNFSLDGRSYPMERVAAHRSSNNKNYIFSKLNMTTSQEKKAAPKKEEKTQQKAASTLPLSQRQKRKLKNKPDLYFKDSSIFFLRPLQYLFADNSFGNFNKKIIMKVVK